MECEGNLVKLGAEQIEQIKVMDWIRHHKLDDVVFHVANERTCSPQHGSILKRMGVKSGVSDLIVARPSKSFHGAFIELKAIKGKPSSSQLKFLMDMDAEGYFTAVVYGADEAILVIRNYLGIESPHQ